MGRQDFFNKGRASITLQHSYGLNYGDAPGELGFILHSQADWNKAAYIRYPSSFPANQWFHVAVTYDGISQVLMYVNGSIVGTDLGTGMDGMINDNSLPMDVGRRDDNNYYFDGQIDEFRIYNRKLSQAEIQDIMNECLCYSGGIQENSEWEYSHNEGAWQTGYAPFGNDYCESVWPYVTNWPNGTMDLRKEFTLSSVITSANGFLAIDNDATIYLNGTQIFSTNSEGCPTKWEYMFDIPTNYFTTGTNEIYIEARDRGLGTGFDFKLETLTPCEECPGGCDDGIDCTADTCIDNNCQFTPDNAFCSNDDVCDGIETCDETLGCQAGTPLTCDDGVDCTDDTCDPIGGCEYTANDANCDDGVDCTDDTCDPTLDCQFTANDANCDDDVFCNGEETCDLTLDCQPGTDPCTTFPHIVCDEDNVLCKAEVVLTAEPGWANGDVGIKVDLCLDNQDHEVGGVQVDVCDEPNCLECVGCEMSERTVLFDCFVNDIDGCCRVVLISKNPGGVINPGLCNIVKIDYQRCDPESDPLCAPAEECEDCITLVPEEMTIADPYGRILAPTGVSGETCPFVCGDVHPAESASGAGDCGDGDVDLMDIMEEVDIALADDADSCQADRADVPTGTPGRLPPGCDDAVDVDGCCPPDGNVDIFDVMVLIDMALDRQDCCTYYYTGVIY